MSCREATKTSACPSVADVRFREVERAIQPAVFVREGVVPVGVRLHVRVQIDGAVVVAELEGGLRRRVEPIGHVAHVRHRRRERDDAGVTEAAEARDGHFEDGPALFGIEEVDLVDDTAVDVRDERVAGRIVFSGRRVGLFGRHHEDVGAFGATRVQIAFTRNDVHRIAEVLEPLPVAFLLVRQRPKRGDEERGSVVAQRLADGEFRERRLPARRRRAGDDVLVTVEQRGKHLALHPVELLEGERLREPWNRLGDLHRFVGRVESKKAFLYRPVGRYESAPTKTGRGHGGSHRNPVSEDVDSKSGRGC